MSEEPPEGFPKPGTTLEGRVAHLFRMMGYDVSRNYFIEGHEIDVYAEKGEVRIIVECKEYYRQLISRDLILIFNTKVRDIRPSEAWFVTIFDFEPSAIELCNRYGIRAVNGYSLEEYEDEAIKNIGSVEYGDIPREDRILRRLKQRRAELSKENRRQVDIRRVVKQINGLRIQKIELPLYLMPASEQDLEEKYIWLSGIDRMPKISEEGTVQNIIVHIGNVPHVKGFEISKELKTDLWIVAVLLTWAISVAAIWQRFAMDYFYLIIPLIITGVIYFYREKLVYKTTRMTYRKTSDSIIGSEAIVIPVSQEEFIDTIGDYPFPYLIGLDSLLVDQRKVGVSSDFIVEKESWIIKGLQIILNQEIISEVGNSTAIIPMQNAEFSILAGKREIKIKALYVLDDYFLKERKRI